MLLESGEHLGVEHDEAAVAGHGIDVLVADGVLHAQGAGHLIAHAGVAVLHMIGVDSFGPPHALHVAGQRAGGADDHVLGVDALVDHTQHRGLRQLCIQILRKAEGGSGIGVVHLGHVIRAEADTVQALELLLPAGDGLVYLGGIGSLVAFQLLEQGGQGHLGIRHQRDGRVHLQGLELGDVDVHKPGVVPEEPLGGGGKVGVAGAHPDDDVRFPGDLIGG